MGHEEPEGQGLTTQQPTTGFGVIGAEGKYSHSGPLAEGDGKYPQHACREYWRQLLPGELARQVSLDIGEREKNVSIWRHVLRRHKYT